VDVAEHHRNRTIAAGDFGDGLEHRDREDLHAEIVAGERDVARRDGPQGVELSVVRHVLEAVEDMVGVQPPQELVHAGQRHAVVLQGVDPYGRKVGVGLFDQQPGAGEETAGVFAAEGGDVAIGEIDRSRRDLGYGRGIQGDRACGGCIGESSGDRIERAAAVGAG
jgi:hypothetical protein